MTKIKVKFLMILFEKKENFHFEGGLDKIKKMITTYFVLWMIMLWMIFVNIYFYF